MSNQEQQFYPSEHYPTLSEQTNQYYQPPNSVNDDPREQQQREMYGGPEYYPGRGEKLQPRPPQRKGFRALWLLPIVLFFLIGGMGYGLFGSHEQSYKHFDGLEHGQVFNVGATPKLIVNDTAGGIIHIHTGENDGNGNTITVRVNKSGDSVSNPTITPDGAAGTITITATQQGSGDNSVNIDITTPKTSDVQVTDGNGNVHIEGVTGSINAQTTQGRIDANNVSGPVTLSSTNGTVSVENGSLSGTSSLHSGNGDIGYNGSLDAQGNYTFDTGNGSVDVRLPSDAAFRLTKSTNGHFGNEFGSDAVGSGTRPSLTVSSENGSIQISKNG